MTTTSMYILMAVLAVIFFVTLPVSPYMSGFDWGFYPGAIILLALIVLTVTVFRAKPHQRLL